MRFVATSTLQGSLSGIRIPMAQPMPGIKGYLAAVSSCNGFAVGRQTGHS